MTQRTRLLILLIISSLTGVLALQGYFLYNDYQQQAEEFKNDVNLAMELTLPEMERLRNGKIHSFFVQDVMDTTFIKMKYSLDEDQNMKVTLLDSKTNESSLSYSYSPKGESEKVDETQIRGKLFDLFKSSEEKFIYMSVSDEIDERMEARRDTMPIDIPLLRSKLNDLFAEREVGASFDLVFLHKDSTYQTPGVFALVSDRFDASYKEDDYQVMAVFEKPFFNILQRSVVILLASVAVVILVFISFAALIKTVNKQRKLSDLKDDFIDNVTHELLTPIATLKITLESLEREEVRTDAQKSSKYLNLSKMEVDRVSDIVHNVLHTSLHEQEQTPLEWEEVNINELLGSLAEYHKTRTDKEVEFSFSRLDQPLINTDKQHFTNILHNLIDNAIKYASTEPVRIDIDLTRSSDSLDITVKDNGRGIATGHEDKIFDKFHRIVNQDEATIRGLGVGLYYVKTIVQKLGGSISLLNSSPNGSSFRVSIQTSSHEA